MLAPGGALFVYTHVRKNAPIAAGPALDQPLARQLERMGPDRPAPGAPAQVGPSEPAARHPGSRAGRARAGFRIGRIRYYTPIVGGFVENILMRMAERAMARRAAARLAHAGSSDAARGRRAGASARRARRAKAQHRQQPRDLRGVSRALSFAMKLDLLLFGRDPLGAVLRAAR